MLMDLDAIEHVQGYLLEGLLPFSGDLHFLNGFSRCLQPSEFLLGEFGGIGPAFPKASGNRQMLRDDAIRRIFQESNGEIRRTPLSEEDNPARIHGREFAADQIGGLQVPLDKGGGLGIKWRKRSPFLWIQRARFGTDITFPHQSFNKNRSIDGE